MFERLSAVQMMAIVSKVFKVDEEILFSVQQGRRLANLPRKFAMYCCKRYCDLGLRKIAKHYGLRHTGSVSNAIHDISKKINEGLLAKELKQANNLMLIQRT